MESSHSQQRKGVLIPLSPPQTPWRIEKAWNHRNWSNSQDEGVNIQVILRCRPLSKEEMAAKATIAISCNEHKREVSAILGAANKQINRTFTFDKVFGPASNQKDFYDQAISPLVNDVLEGYNCTIFAHGQTGTGKTYTMEGGITAEDCTNQDKAGVIPRAAQEIFNVLEAQDVDYTMTVTFLELYNEEITDLLVDDDHLPRRPIALLEDGRGSVLVRGLEEETVHSANEIYKILEKGRARRHTIEAVDAKQSRSHSILSILIYIKECTPDGHEFMKSSKLNLVDLAGSENTYRSGAKEARAREAGEINKSLLTLGRVINALVENSGHVPYRDSKLTRLLRDSLGGKTMTCIIATISPSVYCLDETLNTLDYAHRAKNIQNRPEVNQKLIKSTLINDLYTEIDRLKREVHAAREKNGIYTPQDHYQSEEAEKKAMAEKLDRMEHETAIKNQEHLNELQEMYNDQQKLIAELRGKLEKTQKAYEQTEHAFFDLENSYGLARETIKEKEYTIAEILKSEKALGNQAFELQAEIENVAAELYWLFSIIESKKKIEEGNKMLIHNLHNQLTQQLQALHKYIRASITQHKQQLGDLEENMQFFLLKKSEATEQLKMHLGHLKESYGSRMKYLNELAGELYENSQLAFGNLSSELSHHSSSIADTLRNILLEADSSVNDLQCVLHNQEEILTAFAQQQNEIHVKRLEVMRFTSKVAVDFFKTFSMHTSSMTDIMEDAQLLDDKKLHELEKKFEECAANEERQLTEKVAELIASSNARKRHLIQTGIQSLKESSASRTSKLKQEISDMQHFTSSFKDDWETSMSEVNSQSSNEFALVEGRKSVLEEDFRQCMLKALSSGKQWRKAHESLLTLQERYINSVKSIVKGGVEANEGIHHQLFSSKASAIEEVDLANRTLLSSVEYLYKLDQDACENIASIATPCSERLREMGSNHAQQITEITEIVGKKLEEYVVDEPSSSTLIKGPSK